MISKELLSAVFNDIEADIIETKNDSTIIIKLNNNDGVKFTSFYELAHTVKMWAFKQGYHIQSSLFDDVLCSSVGGVAKVCTQDIIIQAGTEHEAIIQCGEWVLKEISK